MYIRSLVLLKLFVSSAAAFFVSHPTKIRNQCILSSTSTTQNDQFQEFESTMNGMNLPDEKKREIMKDVEEMGFTSSSELYLFSKDFSDRPEVLGSLLNNDFGLNPLKSNLLRGALMKLVEAMEQETRVEDKPIAKEKSGNLDNGELDNALETTVRINGDGKASNDKIPNIGKNDNDIDESQKLSENKKPLFKSVVVNNKAKQRHSNAPDQHNYGLPSNYKKIYPNLAKELDDFLDFMITPSASVQESPIRKTTATVYIRHAKLFLGWYRQKIGLENGNDSLTINDIFPNKEATSAQPIIDFILWLRRTRDISDSYEANMLRGLTKLLKYRYRNESTADPSYGEKSFSDIPVVRELRKLHRDANRRQTLSPRSSEEDRKWLDWDEYLRVVQLLKEDVEGEIQKYEAMKRGTKTVTAVERRIATKFQSYLILSFFSCVPDRQRTFRELEMGKTFLRDSKMDCWVIKHGPEHYKTGSTYGDRPPLVMAQELTPAIDDFLERWRPCLNPTGNHFFVQPRTGNAFTQDTVYSVVARSCYKHTGKKTNPHLLRDMIVTHVRDSDASEKELEALALYMGHSINMQRNSYDRRTMEQKVAPAVELLRNVNTKK